MKKLKYKPSKGFIFSILMIFFVAWYMEKFFPITKERQERQIKQVMKDKNRSLAEEFDRVTDIDKSRLPKFDSRKYALFKRNGRFWLIPREYYADSGFKIR